MKRFSGTSSGSYRVHKAIMPTAHISRFRLWLDSDSAMARIMKNMLWLGSSRGVSAVLSLVYLGIATRTLGVSEFGRFALILSIGALIATFMQFDCWRAILRFGPNYLQSGDTQSLGRLVALCRIFDIGTAIIGCGIAWVVFTVGLPYFGWASDIANSAFLYCCAILFAIKSTPMGVLRLHNRFDLGVYAATMVPVTRVIGALAILVIGPKIELFLLIWGGSEFIAAMAYWILAARENPDALSLRHSRHIAAVYRQETDLLYFLGALNIGSTLTGAIKQVPVLALGGYVSPAAAGLYRLANQLSQALSKVASLLARSAYAEFNHMRARDGMDALRKLLGQTNKLSLIAAVILILVVTLLGKPVLWAVAGEAFVAAYPVLLLLGVAAAFEFMAINYEPALLASTDGKVVLRLRLIGAVLLIALLALLLPRIGIIGAALAVLGSAVANWALFGIAVRKYVHSGDETVPETLSNPPTD
ncbi:MAG: lipopolysaccharide biosynthesis protein [Sphingobium sp.]|nr:lipopolysaccharide biosynthesis protein [Sphingobium sp.]MCP5398647.1 lipopolysaccharide biosynthesis protein [Sphingomonas sp.]